jgi:hypothetical protein
MHKPIKWRKIVGGYAIFTLISSAYATKLREAIAITLQEAAKIHEAR